MMSGPAAIFRYLDRFKRHHGHPIRRFILSQRTGPTRIGRRVCTSAVDTAWIDKLKQMLGSITVLDNPEVVRGRSRDTSWRQPVIRNQLDTKYRIADVVVEPHNLVELQQTVQAAYSLNKNVTVRGAGLGSYGGANTTQGGIVIDMHRYLPKDFDLDSQRGVLTASAGVSTGTARLFTVGFGWDLRVFPTGFPQTGTLAGFVSNSIWGAGSVAWGPLDSPGNVVGLDFIPLDGSNEVIALRQATQQQIIRSFIATKGTLGIITNVQLALAPAYTSMSFMISFPSLLSTIDFSAQIAAAPTVLKQILGFYNNNAIASITSQRRLQLQIPENEHVVLLTANHLAVDMIVDLAKLLGGHVLSAEFSQAPTEDNISPLSFSFDGLHLAHRSMNHERNATHLEIAFTRADRLFEAMNKYAESNWTCDIVAAPPIWRMATEVSQLGPSNASGILYLAKFFFKATTEESVSEMIASFKADFPEVAIFDPNRVDAAALSALPRSDLLELKKTFDPRGLLNPGKLLDE